MNNSIKVSSHCDPEQMIEELTKLINYSLIKAKGKKITVHVKGIVTFDFSKESTITTVLEGIERH